MARSVRQQTKHDAVVARIARSFTRQGYKVKADVKGFTRPDTVGGYRPDVVATKGIDKKIVEVETTTSVKSTRDLKQQTAFRRAAKQRKSTRFIRKVV